MRRLKTTLINRKRLILAPITLVLTALIFVSVIGFINNRFILLNQTKQAGLKISEQIVYQIKNNQASENLAEQLIDEQIQNIINLVALEIDQVDHQRLHEIAFSTSIDEINIYSPNGDILYASDEQTAFRISIGSSLFSFLESDEQSRFEVGNDVITGDNYRYGVKRLDNQWIVQVGISIERLIDLTRSFRYQSLIQRLVTDESIVEVTITDNQSRILASNDLSQIGKTISLSEPIIPKDTMRVVTDIVIDDTTTHFLIMDLSTEQTSALLYQMLLIFAFISAVSIVLILILQRRNVILPVKELDDSIAAIDLEKDRAYRINLNEKNPFQGVGFTINQILDKSHEYFSALQDEKYALRESELRFIESTKQSRTITWEVDSSGLYTYISPAVTDVLGYCPDEIIGKMFFYDFFPPESRSFFKNACFDLFKQKIKIDNFENPLYSKSGQKIWVTTSAIPIISQDGFLLGYRGNDTDITDRKLANEKLLETIQMLEKSEERFRELFNNKQEELTIAYEELISKEKLASLGGLVAGVAHEINTPLGVAITAISFVSDNSRELKTALKNNELTKSSLEKYMDNLEESVSIIDINLNRAARLIRSFKNVAVDQHSEDLSAFHVKPVVEDVLHSLKHQLKTNQHTIALTCKDDLKIRSYPGDLSQILTNLIVNSVLHGFENKKNGHISIEIDLIGNYLKLHYEDNGIGMDPQSKAKLFEPFFTLKKGSGGTGLGMSIVQNIVVSKLNGRISVTSDLGQGMIYDIEFPVEPMIVT